MARIWLCTRSSHMYTYGCEARHAEGRADEAEALQWTDQGQANNEAALLKVRLATYLLISCLERHLYYCLPPTIIALLYIHSCDCVTDHRLQQHLLLGRPAIRASQPASQQAPCRQSVPEGISKHSRRRSTVTCSVYHSCPPHLRSPVS